MCDNHNEQKVIICVTRFIACANKGNVNTFYDFTRQNHFYSRLSTRIAVKSN